MLIKNIRSMFLVAGAKAEKANIASPPKKSSGRFFMIHTIRPQTIKITMGP